MLAEYARGVGGRLGAALHAELREQGRDVVLDRLLGEEHPLADLPVGEPLADQLENPPFLRGQPGQRVMLLRLVAQPGHQLAGRSRVEHGLPGRHRADRSHQVAAADLLEHVSRGPGHDRVHQRVVVGERGQHQAGDLRHPGPYLPAHGHAVAVRQADVEHRHVGAQSRYSRQRGRGGARLADDLDVTFGFQHVADAAPHDLVVVKQEHCDLLLAAVLADWGFHRLLLITPLSHITLGGVGSRPQGRTSQIIGTRGTLCSMVHVTALPQYIPSPPINSFHIGPLDVRFYALGYIIGITLAILITRHRWRAIGGNPDVVNDIALWVVPAGIIGGRIYFDITTPADIPHEWYGVFAVWTGGLGIWGGVALATIVGAWRLRKMGLSVGAFANAIAPGLLVAQAVGRVGNYFNKELFGLPTTLPWGLEIPLLHNADGTLSSTQYRPLGYLQYATFQPSFLYELIWDLALAAFLIWLGHHAKIKYWGLFALYVAGYSGYRIFEESIRIDSSEYFLGLRLNMYIAIFGTLAGLVWFAIVQRRPEKPAVVQRPPAPGEPGDSAEAVGANETAGHDQPAEAAETLRPGGAVETAEADDAAQVTGSSELG